MANKKYFDFIETKPLTPEEIKEIEEKANKGRFERNKSVREKSEQKVKEQVNLKYVKGRIVVSIDIEGKNSHTFEDGTKLYIGREYNNLNRRETQPVNAFVIDAEYIPKGAEILIHPNAIHDSFKIFGFREDDTDVRYYSVQEELCYLWREGKGEWQPLKGYATALRVFKPYQGVLEGIEPKQVKNVLYITSGKNKGKVAHTLKSCDYEIIFMGDKGVVESIIRLRHFEGKDNDREEIVAFDSYLQDQVENGELLVGINISDAKKLNT